MSDLPRVLVRAAQPQDRAAAMDITIAAYQQYASYMPDWGWEMYRADIVETVSNARANEHIVAEVDGKIVGSVLLLPTMRDPQRMDIPEIRLLAVAPDARGLGIGHLLMQECIRLARERGYPEVALHTHDIMAVAMQMYERMGFVRAPEFDFSPIEGEVIKGYRFVL